MPFRKDYGVARRIQMTELFGSLPKAIATKGQSKEQPKSESAHKFSSDSAYDQTNGRPELQRPNKELSPMISRVLSLAKKPLAVCLACLFVVLLCLPQAAHAQAWQLAEACGIPAPEEPAACAAALGTFLLGSTLAYLIS